MLVRGLVGGRLRCAASACGITGSVQEQSSEIRKEQGERELLHMCCEEGGGGHWVPGSGEYVGMNQGYGRSGHV